MTRLILTTSDSAGGYLKAARLADKVIPFGVRLVERPDIEIADLPPDLDKVCEPFDTIDLWIDPDPNAQLILIWLLDYFRSHAAIVSKINLVQGDVSIGNLSPEEAIARRLPAVKLLNEGKQRVRPGGPIARRRRGRGSTCCRKI